MKTNDAEQSRQDLIVVKIQGRMIPYDEFTARLKNLCSTLGFKVLQLVPPGPDKGVEAMGGDDSVIIVSNRVEYNPRWGNYGGLPQRLRHGHGTTAAKQTTSSFIAPYLRQYRLAQKQIFLSHTRDDRYQITLPGKFLPQHQDAESSCLKVDLAKIAQANEQGQCVPAATTGPMVTYDLSVEFLQSLGAQRYGWKQGTNYAIGTYLSSGFFTFHGLDQDNVQENSFAAVLLPCMTQIVTHKTPNLWAAELHLQQEFAQTVKRCHSSGRDIPKNVLCIAGLDIDMTAYNGSEKHYFVPWKAHLERSGKQGGVACPVGQDELFVTLMQQDKM